MIDFDLDPRFKGIEKISGKCLLASPTIGLRNGQKSCFCQRY